VVVYLEGLLGKVASSYANRRDYLLLRGTVTGSAL